VVLDIKVDSPSDEDRPPSRSSTLAFSSTIPLAPIAFVCAGPSCRGDGRAKVCAVLLEAGLMVESSKCLGVCEGPVVAAPIGGRWEVVERLDGERPRNRLVKALMSGKPKKVGGRLVRGSRRKKALRRVLKAFS